MIRGKTDAETCALNGWTVGTRLIGDEGYGPTIIRITAIGERGLYAVTESHNGKPCPKRESSWVLWVREWELAPGEGPLFVPPPPGHDYSTVDQARLAMVAELHAALYGDTWARPESPAVVWRELLDRVTAARQAFLR